MLMVLLDAMAIIAIVFVVNEGAEVDFMPAVIASVGISVGCLLVSLLLGESLGLLAVIPMVLVAIAGIWIGARIPLGRAAIGGVIFMVYKFAISYAFTAFF